MTREETIEAHSRRLDPVGPDAWVGIAANASSGRGRGKRLVDDLARVLRSRGLEPRIAWTVEERGALAAEAARDGKGRCLVAVGGDGTVGALLNEKPTVPIAVIPAGTENLFAGHYGFKRDPEGLADAIVAGRVAPLDLGIDLGRRFSLMAGIGFDADVVNRHHAIRTARPGGSRTTHRGAYVDPVLRASFTYRFPRLKVTTAEGETLEGTTVFVFNLPRYALGLPFAPAAVGDDGLLDLVVFRDGGPWRALHYLWLVLRGLHLKRSGVFHRQTRSVRVESEEPTPVQLDGDPGETLPPGPEGARTIEILPHSVEVVTVPSYWGPHPARRLLAAASGS